MEELPHVDPEEDPYLALRTALAVATVLLLAEPLGVTMAMFPAVMVVSIMSNHRGATTPRVFATPIIMPIISMVFSWLAAVTVGTPAFMVAVMSVLATGGLALMVFKGSRGGMMLTVFPLMMMMMALYSDYALASMRDSMVWGSVGMGAAIVLLFTFFGPKTKRVHVEVTNPLKTDRPLTALFIRVAVYIPVVICVMSTGDMNLMIMPIMLLFVIAEPGEVGRMHQFVDRGVSTMVGGLVAAAMMFIYHFLPEMPVLILLCTIVTYFLIDKMTTGEMRPAYYQYICSSALSMFLSSTMGSTARDAMEVVLQRIVITTAGVMIGVIALALLEAIFLAPRSNSATHSEQKALA